MRTVDRQSQPKSSRKKSCQRVGESCDYSLTASSIKFWRRSPTSSYASRGGGLKAEAGSQRDDTGGESRCNCAEVSISNVIRDGIRVEVQIVEKVVGVDS